MSERIIKFDDVEIATQAFGNPAHEPVLLIMGAMASMLWWPEEFCQQLADRRFYVIRYDNRDTGRSTIYAPGEPPYTMDDMANDAIGILDGYGIDRANLIGMSLGGTIAQIAALLHPERVQTLTLISTTPLGIDISALPQTIDAYMEHAATGETVDWTDDAQVIDFVVRDTRMIAGSRHPYDERRARSLVERDVRRAKNFVSATNHFMLKGGQTLKGKLAELVVPLLVIHGTADPIYPVEHGELLARTVKGAKLLRLAGGGHEIHPDDWDEIISAIDTHLGA
ncbi:pimeloyl-ACP methyl ester carboxylesterase [Rhizobium leguminosarum]|uniref:Pimeloyl-ACP methyl ester carboxylesterase n=1 Tax=Rhizobium leguminosarum TaxID=384 RepID=A0AAE2SY03_RHILE|nr:MULTISPECIES: alpha/beta hydrolase [Rhizobium]MBB4292451.1 pimeloyl-ACP methyl ester carboxylesterase [Rhizobium leguminosarum]MBB4298689.1 pimeloyl-ACP methyl ester carboxylesterase [Rhizobium leguminosarum]MBB4310337.1 pimeloyl-ACP methyl ester carboxylesterase [Rhizobium leguminosarum]MBB4434599.1 pimeloyl-ACP methyl ester carboxylesterase [Rhizobium esperanzae]MBB4531495.1 pimeloyl-ACP methyl ester carboxylesterase [Rhizobium leguminosarum]